MIGKLHPRIPRSLYPTLPFTIREKLCNPYLPYECCITYGIRENKYQLLSVAIRAVAVAELGGMAPSISDFCYLSGLDESELSVIKQRMLDAGWQPYMEDWE